MFYLSCYDLIIYVIKNDSGLDFKNESYTNCVFAMYTTHGASSYDISDKTLSL